MTSTTARKGCAAADQGCPCNGRVATHNVWAFNRRQETIQALPHVDCPQCGGRALPVLVELWGHCFECHRLEAAETYGPAVLSAAQRAAL